MSCNSNTIMLNCVNIVLDLLLNQQKKICKIFFLIRTVVASTVQYNFAMICINQVGTIINYTNEL